MLLLAVALPFGGSAKAEEDELRNRSAVTEPRIQPRFRRELTKVEVQLESISAFHYLSPPGQQASDHVMFRELSDDVQHGVKRAARRAVRDYVLEAAEIDRKIDDWQAARTGGAGRRMDFDVGIHSFSPEVAMKYRLDGGQLKLSVGLEGDVGLNFRAAGSKIAGVGIGFNGDDTYSVNFRLGF